MKMKPKIFNYTESTYGIKKFGAQGYGRVDVTYFARLRSRNAFLQRLLKLPHMWNCSTNWIRERICQGEGGMDQIITDDSIYVETRRNGNKVIGKFTVDNKWIPFDPPLKPILPYIDELEKVELKGTKTDIDILSISHTFCEECGELTPCRNYQGHFICKICGNLTGFWLPVIDEFVNPHHVPDLGCVPKKWNEDYTSLEPVEFKIAKSCDAPLGEECEYYSDGYCFSDEDCPAQKPLFQQS